MKVQLTEEQKLKLEEVKKIAKSWLQEQEERLFKNIQEQSEKLHFTAQEGSKLDKIWKSENPLSKDECLKIDYTQRARESTNYMHVVPNSQRYGNLEQLKTTMEHFKYKYLEREKHRPESIFLTTIEEDLDYIIKGIENTIQEFELKKKETI